MRTDLHNEENSLESGYEDLIEQLCQGSNREFSDISGAVISAIRAERLRQRWFLSAVASLAACVVGVVVITYSTMKSAPELESLPVRVAETDVNSMDPQSWLVLAQEGDGTWNPARWGGSQVYLPAMTGLAMLSLSKNDGFTYESAIEQAVRALCAIQQSNGDFAASNGTTLFNHALATVALLDVYGTGDYPELFSVLDNAVVFIRDAQNEQGDWTGGSLVNAWMVNALSRANQFGWQDLGGHLRRGIRRVEGADAFAAVAIRDATTFQAKCDAVGEACSSWLLENPSLTGGGMIYEQSVAALAR